VKAIRYKIKTINPIIIRFKRGDANMVNTKSYIPGSNILGVFASLYIKNKGLGNAHKNAVFHNWFLNGDLVFTNAFISDDKRKYFPNPHSLKKEKYKEENVYDEMFSENNNKSLKSNNAFISIDEENIYSMTVKKSISFHHSKDNEASENGAIFNYESISEGQVFEGNIIGNAGKENEFLQFIKEFKNQYTVYIGLSKNSQYGKAKIELLDEFEYEQEIETDIESDDTDIAMTFLSDTIIYNDNGFSTADNDNLEKLLAVKIKKSFIRKTRAEQFIGVWKLKNQSETAFETGSCFLIDKLPDNYREMQIKGIGERTNEGFGRVVFGWQSGESQYSNNVILIETPEKPNGEPPKIVKNIIIDIIKERFRDKIVSKAINDAHLFKKLPTKSLCGKLQSIVGDMAKFQDNLKEIVNNEPAKNQLIKCNNGTERLLDYISKNSIINIKSLLNQSEFNSLDNFTNELKDSKDIKIDMYKLYLKTFFNFMRKDKRRDNE
jgi:CRISPR-associated protein Csx10